MKAGRSEQQEVVKSAGGRRLRAVVWAMLGLSLTWIPVHGKTALGAPAAGTPAPAAEGTADADAEADEDTADAPAPAPSPKARRKSRKKSSYGKSRFTSDKSEAAADRRYLRLSTGEDRTVDLDFEPSKETGAIVIGNPKVVATTLIHVGDKPQLVFKPLGPGETNVTVRGETGDLKLVFEIQVSGSNMLRLAGEIRTLLRDVEGIDVRIVGAKVIIDGEVLVPQDYARVVTIVNEKIYGENVINMATLSPLALQVLAKKIQDDIQVFAPEVKTRVVNGLIFLEGQVQSSDQAERAKRVATLYLPEVRPASAIESAKEGVQRLPARYMVQSFITILPAPPKKQEKLVRVTVHFVELAKDYNRLFNFKWQPGFASDPKISLGSDGTTGAVTSGGLSLSGTISSLFPKLQSAQAAGYARILKTGTVVVRSGQVGKLTESMGFPFIASASSGAVQSGNSEVGLALSVTPAILGQSEDIAIDIDIQQSNVVGTYTSGQAPVVSKHAITTKLYVKSNESAAVGGVSSSDVGTDFNKNDPNPTAYENGSQALFTLMRSKNYRKKKAQFVIFVTPQIIESASEGTEDLKKNFRVKVK